MRKRTCHELWERDCHRHTVTRQRNLALVLVLAASTMLSGCILDIPTPTLGMGESSNNVPLDETGPWTHRGATDREVLLSRSDFSMEIVRVTDSRRPRSMMAQSTDQMIYQYDPDVLLQGVSTNVPAMLSKYLSYRPKMPKHYKVELDIKKLVTDIKTGSLWSGHWGRYHVAFDIAVIVRRPDSTVALQKTFHFEDEQARKDFDGRGPTRELDRARMYDLSDDLFRKAAEAIGWEVREHDARKWKAPAPQSIPTRLNLPPVDRASGTTDADTPPATLQPTGPALQAPIIAPSAPASGWIDGPAPEDKGTPMEDLPVYTPQGEEGPVI